MTVQTGLQWRGQSGRLFRIGIAILQWHERYGPVLPRARRTNRHGHVVRLLSKLSK